MTKKKAVEAKGKLKKLSLKRTTVRDLSAMKPAAERVKGGGFVKSKYCAGGGST